MNRMSMLGGGGGQRERNGGSTNGNANTSLYQRYNLARTGNQPHSHNYNDYNTNHNSSNSYNNDDMDTECDVADAAISILALASANAKSNFNTNENPITSDSYANISRNGNVDGNTNGNANGNGNVRPALSIVTGPAQSQSPPPQPSISATAAPFQQPLPSISHVYPTQQEQQPQQQQQQQQQFSVSVAPSLNNPFVGGPNSNRNIVCESCRTSRKKCEWPHAVSNSSTTAGMAISGVGGAVANLAATPCVRCAKKRLPCHLAGPTDTAKQPSSLGMSITIPMPLQFFKPQQSRGGFIRNPVSCKSCYAKKLRCDRTKPVCSCCQKRNLVCEYWHASSSSLSSSIGATSAVTVTTSTVSVTAPTPIILSSSSSAAFLSPPFSSVSNTPSSANSLTNANIPYSHINNNSNSDNSNNNISNSSSPLYTPTHTPRPNFSFAPPSPSPLPQSNPMAISSIVDDEDVSADNNIHRSSYVFGRRLLPQISTINLNDKSFAIISPPESTASTDITFM
ncbi:hypothetical protein HK100_008492 [Physocladia obscura]|uniref:Zn(2)-C6 fungal-type domain-containing protein n=1 Tax=Physocladia obscura TaxID=109957 RepID=A0AAD5T4R6_9FUNG|nr:hypothetical protein HK100_008492 [Physocladia obscura]